MDTNFEQKVREKAYEIWMAAGMDGAADAHWIAAEQSVMNETVRPTKAVASKKPAAKPAAAKAASVKKSAAPKGAKAKQVKH